jgi:hypothetical protein
MGGSIGSDQGSMPAGAGSRTAGAHFGAVEGVKRMTNSGLAGGGRGEEAVEPVGGAAVAAGPLERHSDSRPMPSDIEWNPLGGFSRPP